MQTHTSTLTVRPSKSHIQSMNVLKLVITSLIVVHCMPYINAPFQAVLYLDHVSTEADCLAKTITCDTTFLGFSANDLSNGESCQPDLRATTSINYMTITFYCGWTTDTRPNTCPADDTMFFHRGIAKFSTNICVDQGNGEYFMATCDSETGEIGIYDGASCNNKIGTYRQYTRSCDNYASPDPAFDSCNYFRRVTTCMVNGVNILTPTTKPSSAQTKDPSDSPSNDPTQIPTRSVFCVYCIWLTMVYNTGQPTT
eukprot:16818_1